MENDVIFIADIYFWNLIFEFFKKTIGGLNKI
jgi:hypothetical protein